MFRVRMNLKTKIALGLLVPYSSYALWVSLNTTYAIKKREHLEKHEKYATLQILGRFENPFKEYRIQTLFEFFANRFLELFQRNRGQLPGNLDEFMPIRTPEFGQQLGPNKMSVTWLGQSTTFIEMPGLKILTDPLFSDYIVHPVLGPKRVTKQPVPIKELPMPDVVLVSHNHPDHLDHESMAHFGDKVTWYIPRGLGSFFVKNGISNYIELDWWETAKVGNYKVSATPAMHWSGRTLLDTNQSLWCSFMVSREDQPLVFHAGDTGYVPDLYPLIREKFGSNVSLALLPCGQYCPEWHQKPRHVSPSECLNIMDDLQARRVMGIHWGTFVLSGESFMEPKMLLEQLGKGRPVACPELGKTYLVDM